MSMMRAVVYTKYGAPDVLHVEEVERPIPAANEVLVRVHATTVNRTDSGFRTGRPVITRAFSGVFRPRYRILGSEFAGVVEAAGDAVTSFAVGDRVFGVKSSRFGAHADYVCVPESAPIATMPDDVGFNEAAAVCDGVVLALANLRRAKVGRGTRILVYGASGSIGTAGVQLAKHLGAHVTAVCTGENLDLVRSLGADAVIDYTATDFTAIGETYDVVFDAVGKTSFRRCRRLLVPGGIYLSTDLGFLWHVPFLALITRVLPGRNVSLPVPSYRKAEVILAKELIEKGEYRPVVDRCYPLEQVVAATAYVDSQQKVGNVVLTLVD
jgi:NADPH:quinone reductase-like Zn-dependent oxidoreductase